ncbi:MAG: hypothetical protein BRC44_07270 [Cyanobacteria bacterium QS_4_48_99]|nr:MAG: hypothetical protein BRC44_07270 [Cyanobacteria bacterium QS_4_48_99]
MKVEEVRRHRGDSWLLELLEFLYSPRAPLLPCSLPNSVEAIGAIKLTLICDPTKGTNTVKFPKTAKTAPKLQHSKTL